MAARFSAKSFVSELLTTHLRPHLVPLGFRKVRNNFWRDKPGDYCDILAFQMNRWGTSTKSSVCVHAAIYFHKVECLANPAPPKVPPPYYQCTIQRHFGNLINEIERDWPVDINTDPNELAASLLLTATRAITWLDSSHSLTAILRRPDFGQPPPIFNARVAALQLLNRHKQVKDELACAHAIYLEDRDVHRDFPDFVRRLGVKI